MAYTISTADRTISGSIGGFIVLYEIGITTLAENTLDKFRIKRKCSSSSPKNTACYYVDDGYTGTNFNRPGFQKMIEDIDLGYISTVVVKDLSRLGRRYDTVGYYTDTYFPDRAVQEHHQ